MALDKFLKWSTTKRDLLLLLSCSLMIKASIAILIKVISPDGVRYISAAQQFAEGSFVEGLGIYAMPFYPLMIAITHFFITDWITAARVLSLIFSVLTVIPLYLLTKDLFGREAALWGSAAFVISPVLNHLSVKVLRDPAFLFFFAWTIYFAHHAIRTKRPISFLMTALLSSFSFLFRLEGIVLFPCYTLFVIYLSVRNPEERTALLRGAMMYIGFPILFFGVVFLLLTGKGVDFNRTTFLLGHIKDLFNFKFLNNYMLIYKELEKFEVTTPGYLYGYNFVEIARHYMHTIYFIGLIESFVKAIFPPFVIPLALGFWHSKVRNRGFLIFLVACYLLMIYYFFIWRDSIRPRLLVAPALLLYPWIGIGLHRVATSFKQASWARFLTILLIALLGVLCIYKSVDILWKRDTAVIKAGQWIGRMPGFQESRLLTNDRRVPFYAGRRGGYIVSKDPDYLALERRAVRLDLDLLIIRTSIKKENSRPKLKVFKKIKEFVGIKQIVNVYCSPKFSKVIGVKAGG